MPTPSTQLALPQIAGSDSPDVPRDINAVITALEANEKRLATRDVFATGIVGQSVAGRPLLPADFTDQGLAIPTAIYNCSDANDSSGNALNLTNKGVVPFTTGITGAAAEAALFVGTSTQGLWRADTGAADPFRFRTCSVGGWFQISKRAYSAYLVSKINAASTDRGFALLIDVTNTASFVIGHSAAPTAWQAAPLSITDVCDNRWHFLVGSFDGARCRIYVDGVLENSKLLDGAMNGSAGPLNVGGGGAVDASTSGLSPPLCKADAVFLTSDILSEDQIRCLMGIKITHVMSRTPRRVDLSIHRRRRGAILVPTDFPATPNRIYNLDDLNDDSGNAVTLTANAGTGSIISVAGPDGVRAGARQYNGAHTGDSATDAALPAALTSCSMGAWIKVADLTATRIFLSYGTVTTGERTMYTSSTGVVSFQDGPTITSSVALVIDGEWHHCVTVIDNAALDGLKVKLYVDGRLNATATTLASTTLVGANRFRVGARTDGTVPFSGTIARAFVSPTAFTPEQLLSIYYKASTQDTGWSPRDPAPHIERLDATNVLLLGDTLEPQDRIELGLTA
jgi:hypothetical protein